MLAIRSSPIGVIRPAIVIFVFLEIWWFFKKL
jgi:hypothetical protein